MTVIECKKCRVSLPSSEFREWRGRLNSWCNACRERNNKWYAEDKDGRRTKAQHYYRRIKHKVARYRSDLRLDRKYKLTRQEWEAMFASQKGLCAICREPMEVPCVDHDHETGEVRGLLHRMCNLKLQAFEDKEFFQQAQRYLDSMK